jgi:hypothetical protein
MKKKVSRDMLLFLILIPVFLVGAFYISSRLDKNLPSYTIDNKGREGYSVFYETLKELKLNVERTLTPVELQNSSSVQIVPSGGSFNLNNKEIKSWVEKGGSILYLTYGGIAILPEAGTPEIKDGLSIYKVGAGRIITADSAALTNNALIRNKAKAYIIYKEIAGLNKPISFNESYIYSDQKKVELWDYISLEIKFIIYQLIIVLAAFFYYKGRRFGRPVPLYEETERNENEYIYSAASLYRAAKCLDLMVENYYSSLLRELKCNSEEFLEVWRKKSLPDLDKAERVYEFIKNETYKKKSKECVNIISVIEQLRKIVRKRRETYWKTLKKV